MLSKVFYQMIKTWWILFTVLLPVKLYSAEYGVNLIKNGGAESGLPSDGVWSKVSYGEDWFFRSSNPSANEGNQYFAINVVSSFFTSTLRQYVDITAYADAVDNNAQCFEISAVMRGHKNTGASSWVAADGYKISHPDGLATWRRQKKLVFTYPGNRTIAVSLNVSHFKLIGSTEEGALQFFDDIRLIALDPAKCQPKYMTNLIRGSWGDQSGKWEDREEDPTPREGADFHFAGTSGGIAARYNNVDLSDYIDDIQKGNQHFKISSYMAGYHGTDKAFQTYTFFDSEGKVISYFTSPVFKSKKVWRYYTKTLRAPKNAVRLKILLQSDRVFGINSDGYHDDVRVTALDPAQFTSRDLLFNGSADMPISSTYGWINRSGKYGRRNSDPTGKDGGYYFYCQNNYCKADQLIDLTEFSDDIDKGIQEFRYAGYQSGWNSRDTSEVAVEYIGLDEEGKHKRLSIWWSGRITSSKSWRGKSHTRIAPVGTRFAKIHIFSRHGGGWFNNNNDGYIDKMSFVQLPVDRDGDGIPNVIEVSWGLNPDDPADAALDLDNDGFTNVQEYTLGTDAQDPTDSPNLKVNAFYSDKLIQYSDDNEQIKLHWEVSGAETIEIFQNGVRIESYVNSGDRMATGSIGVFPQIPSTYHLIANGPYGSGFGSLHIDYKERNEYPEWPDTLEGNTDFILDSLTLLSDGSHFVGRTDESYCYYKESETGLKTLAWQINDLGLVHKKAALANGMAIVSASSPSQSKGKIVAMNLDGSIAWQYDTDTPIKANPVVDSSGNTLFAVSYFGEIYALNAQTGVLLWALQIPEDDLIVLSAPALKEEKNSEGVLDYDQSMLVIRTTDNRLFAYRANGQSEMPVWSKSLK